MEVNTPSCLLDTLEVAVSLPIMPLPLFTVNSAMLSENSLKLPRFICGPFDIVVGANEKGVISLYSIYI